MRPLLLYLNLTFLIFLLSYRFPELASLHVLTTFLMLLWLTWREDDIYFTHYDLALFALIVFNILLIPLLGVSWRELAFLAQFSLAILVFRRAQLDLPTFLKYANLTYVFYAMLSYLVYFGVVTPGIRGTLEGINQFEANSFGLSFRTLIGFNGTTAGIDAYSAIILLLNADPMLELQASAIAEAYLEEIMLKPYYDPDLGAPGGVCPAAEVAGRTVYDNVCDYDLLDDVGPIDQNGVPVAGLAPYRVRVNVDTLATLGALAGPADVVRADVRVTHASGLDLTLSGYRARF